MPQPYRRSHGFTKNGACRQLHLTQRRKDRKELHFHYFVDVHSAAMNQEIDESIPRRFSIHVGKLVTAWQRHETAWKSFPSLPCGEQCNRTAPLQTCRSLRSLRLREKQVPGSRPFHSTPSRRDGAPENAPAPSLANHGRLPRGAQHTAPQ